MKNTIYLSILSIISIILFVSFHLFQSSSYINCSIKGFGLTLIILSLTFACIHFILISTLNNFKKFIRVFMIVLTVKFLFLIILLFLGLLANKHNAKCYILSFLITYIILVLFETIMLIKDINTKQP